MINMRQQAALVVLVILAAFRPSPARGHCDALDGPVVRDAKAALGRKCHARSQMGSGRRREGDSSRFREDAEGPRSGMTVADLADHHFFETLVRIHRSGEGVAYTGLKPAGTVDPGIAAADKAGQGFGGSAGGGDWRAVRAGLREHFAKVVVARRHADESVEAERAYVTAYVEYIHYVEAGRAGVRPTERASSIHASDR